MRLLRRKLWLLLLLPILLFCFYEFWFFLHICWWINHNPSSTRFMESRLEQLRSKDARVQLKQQWVPYERISPNLKRAIIAAEDAKFVDHEGFDWEGIQKAVEVNQRKGRIVKGGSTITQQLAKNLFLTGERSFVRKGQEAIVTYMLEQMMDKERIFEIYLNVAEWGNGVFGAEAAARHYYGINAAAVDAEQAAILAAMLPNPRFYERHRNAKGLLKKTEIILVRMGSVQIP